MALEVPSFLSPRARRWFAGKAQRVRATADGDLALADDLARARGQLRADLDHVQLGDLVLGIALPHAQHGAVHEAEGAPTVLVGLRWNSDPLVLDARGRIFERGGWRPGDPFRLLAESARALIERHALHEALLRLPLVVELDRRLGAALGERLALAPIAEASDTDALWLGSPDARGLTILDGEIARPDRGCTTLLGSVADLARAVRAARAIERTVRARVHERHPLDLTGRLAEFTLHEPRRAPKLPARAAHAVRLYGPPWSHPIEGMMRARGAELRALETHEGRVLIERTWTDAGASVVKRERRFLQATERIAPHVTPKARKRLRESQASFDPRGQLSAGVAERWLRAAGVADPSRLVTLEGALGGLLFGEDLHGLRFGLAVAGGVPSRLVVEDDGRVAFGLWSDARILADADGRVHFVDDIDGTDHVLADDAAHLLERRLRADERGIGATFSIDALLGARAAAAVGAALVPELSDGARRIWEARGVRIEEGPAREGAVETHVVVRTMAAVRRIAAALVGAEATASSMYGDVADALGAKGLSIARQSGERDYFTKKSAIAERARVAAATGADEAALETAGVDESAAVRLAVAERADATAGVLASILEKTSASTLAEVSVLDAIARHAHVTDTLLGAMVERGAGAALEGAVLRAVASSQVVAEARLEALASDPRPEVRHAVASSPRTDADTITRLARDADPRVRRAIAAHASTSPEALRALATDDDREVRLEVARAVRTPEDALGTLAADPDPSFAYALAMGRTTLTPDAGLRAAFHPWALREIVIARVPLPEPAVRDLSRSPITACRKGVASRRDAPVDVLRALVLDDEPVVRALALGHPSLASDALEGVEAARAAHPLVSPAKEIETDPPPHASLARVWSKQSRFRGAWAGHPTFPPSMLAALAADPDTLVGYAAAAHPWLTDEAILRLSKHPYAYTRRVIAAHPRASDAVRLALLGDREAMVRAAAAARARLDEPLWERLSDDPADEVREVLARRADCTRSRLEAFARDPKEYVRRGVAGNESAPPALLASLSRDPHVQIRSRLPLNPACPLAAIEPLLDDPDPQVRDAATWRLLATRPYESLRRGER